jgi:hypothetical protein
MSFPLPADYLAYIQAGGRSEASTDGLPGYFALWPPDQIEASNRAYEVSLYAPGFLGFGTDGGGELLAFDASGAVFMLPLVGMEPRYAKKVADTWHDVSGRITPVA